MISPPNTREHLQHRLLLTSPHMPHHLLKFPLNATTRPTETRDPTHPRRVSPTTTANGRPSSFRTMGSSLRHPARRPALTDALGAPTSPGTSCGTGSPLPCPPSGLGLHFGWTSRGRSARPQCGSTAGWQARIRADTLRSACGWTTSHLSSLVSPPASRSLSTRTTATRAQGTMGLAGGARNEAMRIVIGTECC
jgi:hypothetical protein